MKFKINMLIFLLIIVISSSAAYAKVGMITRVLSQQEVLINLGKMDGLAMGQDVTIYRNGIPVATGKIQSIDDTNAIIRLLEIKDVPSLGDAVARSGENIDDVTVNPNSSVQTYVAPQSTGSPPIMASTTEPSPLSINCSSSVQSNYVQILSDRTKICVIDPQYSGESYGGIGSTSDIVQDVFAIWTAVQLWDPVYAATTGVSIATRPKMGTDYDYYSNGNPVEPPSSKISAVLWDRELVKSYSEYWAYQKAGGSDEASQCFREQMSNYSIDSCTVFQLVMENHNAYPVALAPFKFRAYLIDGDGSRYALVRYDDCFEKELKPGARVSGFIYFPKVNSKQYELHIEQVFGENFEMKWNL